MSGSWAGFQGERADLATEPYLELFHSIDVDGSGTIERDEFVAFMLLLCHDHSRALEWWRGLSSFALDSH